MENTRELKDDSAKQERKLAYEKPTLNKLGSVVELTLGGTGPLPDTLGIYSR